MQFLLFAVIAALSDVLAVLLFMHPKTTRLFGTRYTIAFASGAMISLALFELLPQSQLAINSVYVGLGFFTFYLIEKLVMLHACGEKECEAHTVGWISVVGMASDNIVDGVGIAAGYLIQPALGLLIAIGVILHELPQGVTTATLLKNSGFTKARIFTILSVAGSMYIIGALLSGFVPEEMFTAVIAFVAGSFIYIGAGDLMLEAHKRFNLTVIFLVVLGAVAMYVIELVV